MFSFILSIIAFPHADVDSAGHYFEESLSAYRNSAGPHDPAFLAAQDDFCRFLLCNGKQEVRLQTYISHWDSYFCPCNFETLSRFSLSRHFLGSTKTTHSQFVIVRGFIPPAKCVAVTIDDKRWFTVPVYNVPLQRCVEIQKASLATKRSTFGDLSAEVADTLQLIGSVEMTEGRMKQAHRTMTKVITSYRTQIAQLVFVLYMHIRNAGQSRSYCLWTWRCPCQSIWEDIIKGQESAGVSFYTSEKPDQNIHTKSPCYVEMSYFHRPP